MRNIVLIAHNLRSCHNVGSLLRTADGLGVSKVYLTGYTPYPQHDRDIRLPHISAKVTKQIQKTALGAEDTVSWQQDVHVLKIITQLRNDGYVVAALEQTPKSIDLPSYTPESKIAIIVGRETYGLEPEIIDVCDVTLEIPMSGKKESFNVVQAAAIALYHCMYYNTSYGSKAA